MPTLRQLSYLVALSEDGRFARAAERCNVTQPTLSAQIAAMEARLGARLVDRGGRSANLTPIGRAVAERARRMLEEERAIWRIAAEAKAGGPAGVLRLGASPTLGPYFLPLVAQGMRTAFPAMRLHVREGPPSRLQREAAEGRFDLILGPTPIVEPALESAMLFREPLWLAMATDDLLAGPGPIAAEALAGRGFLTLDAVHHYHSQIRTLCARWRARVLGDYEGTSLDALRQMAASGVGLAVTPALYARSEIAGRSDVVAAPIDDPDAARDIALSWPRDSGSAALNREIADHLRDAAAHLPELSPLPG